MIWPPAKAGIDRNFQSRMKSMVLIMPSRRTLLLISLCVCMIQGLAVAAAAEAPPTPGNFDGPAELPRILMGTAMHDTPTPGKAGSEMIAVTKHHLSLDQCWTSLIRTELIGQVDKSSVVETADGRALCPPGIFV